MSKYGYQIMNALPMTQIISMHMHSTSILFCLKIEVSATNILGVTDINVAKRTSMAIK